MAQLNDMNFNMGIEVSEQTVQRCCLLLQMFFEDHPNKTINLDFDYAGEHPRVWIGEKGKNK